MRRRIHGGFTLTELLIVIGIIALLISLLLPAVSRAQKQAQKVKCASNMAQIGVANQIYAQTTGFYPGDVAASVSDPTTGDGSIVICAWAPCLRQYLGSTDVFYCPSEPIEEKWQMIIAGAPYTFPVANPAYTGYGYKFGEVMLFSSGPNANLRTIVDFSYGWNDWGAFPSDQPNRDYVGEAFAGENSANSADSPIGMGLGGNVDQPGSLKPYGGRVKNGHIKDPSDFVVVTDRDRYAPIGQQYAYRYNVDPNPASSNENPSKIHSGGSNVLFGDGHVTWISQKDLMNVGVLGQTFTPDQQAVRSMWNRDHQP